MTQPTDPPDSMPPNDGTFAALPGEGGIPSVADRPRRPWSRKGLLALVMLVLTLAVATALAVARLWPGRGQPTTDSGPPASHRPAATTQAPKALDLSLPPPAAPAARPAPPAGLAAAAPATEPQPQPGPPAAVHTPQAPPMPADATPRSVPPEDAPALLVSAHQGPTSGGPPLAAPEAATPLEASVRNLAAYQRQLQGLMDKLASNVNAATAPPPEPPPIGGPLLAPPPAAGPPPPPSGGLFGGTLQGGGTPRATATLLGNRSLTLPRGTAFTCALKTRVISATSGLVACQVMRHVYGDDGRVLLIERGSHLDGEYRIASLRAGMVRIPVLWTRLRTPHGVVVDIESPGTGALGEAGIDGHVDNRWGERIGAAMLLSLIDDSVKLVIQHHSGERAGDTILLPGTTANTSKLAEKVLDSTIHIPPLVYQNQGGVVGIVVARDVDFSAVYELRPAPAP